MRCKHGKLKRQIGRRVCRKRRPNTRPRMQSRQSRRGITATKQVAKRAAKRARDKFCDQWLTPQMEAAMAKHGMPAIVRQSKDREHVVLEWDNDTATVLECGKRPRDGVPVNSLTGVLGRR